MASGRPLSEVVGSGPGLRGHAIEARVCAEDPVRFLPSPGRLEVFRPPAGSNVRIETGFSEGQEVTRYYDPLLAKVIAWGSDRSDAWHTLVAALRRFTIEGVKSNIPALIAVLESPEFRNGAVHTELLSDVLARTGKEYSVGDA